MLANVLQQLATAISSSIKRSAATSGVLSRGLSGAACHCFDKICRSFVMLPARLSTSWVLWWLDMLLLVVTDSARRTDCKARRANDTLACRVAGSTDGAAALIGTTACITTRYPFEAEGKWPHAASQRINLYANIVCGMQHQVLTCNKKMAWRKNVRSV